MTARRVPVSIICVFNDPVVRERCLDRSIAALRHETPEVEYLPIDNVNSAFASAGAALNHGASMARHEYLVFVHQDVYLHSLVALEEAAGLLAGDGGFGLLGSFGFGAAGTLTGFIRDRVVLLGAPVPEPVDVDSLDEVLFMASASQIASMPLTEHPDLAWHAYAVEYGLRIRDRGLRVAAAHLPVTHNSLTINLDRLDVAHRAVAAAHPRHLPVRTTCGVITSSDPEPGRGALSQLSQLPSQLLSSPMLAAQRWRYRWMIGSWAAHSARRAAGGGPVVLGDIRLDIDDVIATAPEPFAVFNLDPSGRFAGAREAPLELFRRDHRVLFSSGDLAQLTAALHEHDSSTPMLLTNLDSVALRALAPGLADRQHLIGFHPDYACWVLLQTDLVTIPAQWRDRASVPLGMPALAR